MALAPNEIFPQFINGQMNLPSPVTTDLIAVIRGNVTYKMTVAAFIQYFGGELTVVPVIAGASAVLADINQFVSVNKTIASATSLTLPVTTTIGRYIEVSDTKGDAGVNNITILPGAGATIEGQTSTLIFMNRVVLGFRYVAANLWKVE